MINFEYLPVIEAFAPFIAAFIAVLCCVALAERLTGGN